MLFHFLRGFILSGILSFGFFAHSAETQDVSAMKEDIRRSVKTSLKDMKICYETALTNTDSKSKLEGKVTMSWEIDASGKAQNIVFKNDDIGSEELQGCMKEALQKIKFSKPTAEKHVVTAYPFVFMKNKDVKAGGNP